MKKTVVIYNSKYGSTKQYATWLADELEADLIEARYLSKANLNQYGLVIYGGSVFASTISGLEKLAKVQKQIKDMPLIIFSCGLTSPNDETNIQKITDFVNQKVPNELHDNLKLFLLQGGINIKKLSFFHKMILSTIEKSLKKKNDDDLTPSEKSLLESLSNSKDYTEKKNIEPILEYIKTLS